MSFDCDCGTLIPKGDMVESLPDMSVKEWKCTVCKSVWRIALYADGTSKIYKL